LTSLIDKIQAVGLHHHLLLQFNPVVVPLGLHLGIRYYAATFIYRFFATNIDFGTPK